MLRWSHCKPTLAVPILGLGQHSKRPRTPLGLLPPSGYQEGLTTERPSCSVQSGLIDLVFESSPSEATRVGRGKVPGSHQCEVCMCTDFTIPMWSQIWHWRGGFNTVNLMPSSRLHLTVVPHRDDGSCFSSSCPESRQLPVSLYVSCTSQIAASLLEPSMCTCK